MEEPTNYENLPGEEEKPKMTKNEKKLDKYKTDMEEIDLNRESYENGINQDRQCTDMLCLLVFGAFLLAMVGITGYTIKEGNVNQMIAPVDYDHNLCGFGERADYQKLYFAYEGYSEASDILNKGVCMKTCPEQHAQISTDVSNIHQDDVTRINNYNSYYSGADKGAYKSKSVIDYCIPTPTAFKEDRPEDVSAVETALKLMTQSGPGVYLNDLYLSSTSIFYSMGTAFALCILYIYLMSIFAEYLAWGLVILTQLGLIAVAGGAFVYRGQLAKEAAAVNSTPDAEQQKSLLIMGIMAGLFSMLFACMIFCGYSQLKTAIDVIDAAADFLAKTKRILAVPVLYFFITMIVIAVWMGAMMALLSMGEITAKDNQQKSVDIDNDPKLEKKMFYMGLFMFFGLLWIVNFLKAQSSFITMVATATYYFDSNPERDGNADVGLGFKFAFMFHAGSIAFGSFIIAVIQFIRTVFAVLAEQAENASGDNAAVKIMIACGKCCLKCIEKVVDYINTMAYGYMAVSGDSFCSSAWNGFLLNLKYGLEFAWANFIASAFILLGKIGLTVLNTFICFQFMKARGDLEEVHSVGGPLAIILLVTFAAANIFLSLFDEAVLAMLVCLCVDKQINGGEAQKGPPTFHDSFEKGQNHDQNKVRDDDFSANQVA